MALKNSGRQFSGKPPPEKFERGKNTIKPTSPAKQAQTDRRNGVVGHVARGKGSVAAPLVRFVGPAHIRFLKDRHKLRAPFFELHHSHRLEMLWPLAINRRFQRI